MRLDQTPRSSLILCCLLIWQACGSSSTAPICKTDGASADPACKTEVDSSAAGPACKTDGECPNGFCDRGACTSVGGESSGNHGVACEPTPISPETGRPEPRRHPCGAYLCLENRCRSCTSDDECRTMLGSPTCGTVPGWPGRRCGNYAVIDAGPPGEAPDATGPPP